MSKTDEEIIDATMGEIARLFPQQIAEDPKWSATVDIGLSGSARLTKFAVVRTPRSVYAAVPGRNKFRPSQVPAPFTSLDPCHPNVSSPHPQTPQLTRRCQSAMMPILLKKALLEPTLEPTP
jgi:hypothetical protein